MTVKGSLRNTMHMVVLGTMALSMAIAAVALLLSSRPASVVIRQASAPGTLTPGRLDEAYVSTFAHVWLQRLTTVSSYSFQQQALWCANYVAKSERGSILKQLIELNKFYQAANKTQEATVTACVVTPASPGRWLVEFTLAGRIIYGPISAGAFTQSGSMTVQAVPPTPGQRYAVTITGLRLGEMSFPAAPAPTSQSAGPSPLTVTATP